MPSINAQANFMNFSPVMLIDYSRLEVSFWGTSKAAYAANFITGSNEASPVPFPIVGTIQSISLASFGPQNCGRDCSQPFPPPQNLILGARVRRKLGKGIPTL
jgi:hypothetical protein